MINYGSVQREGREERRDERWIEQVDKDEGLVARSIEALSDGFLP